jgi:hypothetical protein
MGGELLAMVRRTREDGVDAEQALRGPVDQIRAAEAGRLTAYPVCSGRDELNRSARGAVVVWSIRSGGGGWSGPLRDWLLQDQPVR